MSNQKFKEGDLVYRLSRTKGVLLCELNAGENDWLYVNVQKIDKAGFLPHQYCLPYVIHATPENRQALVTLYGEDAVPKLPLRGSELTKKLLEKQKYVLCWVSDRSDNQARDFSGYLEIVERYDNTFVSTSGERNAFAVPVDLVTGEEITEVQDD